MEGSRQPRRFAGATTLIPTTTRAHENPAKRHQDVSLPRDEGPASHVPKQRRAAMHPTLHGKPKKSVRFIY